MNAREGQTDKQRSRQDITLGLLSALRQLHDILIVRVKNSAYLYILGSKIWGFLSKVDGYRVICKHLIEAKSGKVLFVVNAFDWKEEVDERWLPRH